MTHLERSGKLRGCVLFGVIKEVEEGDQDTLGIKQFQQKYFPYPIYRDEWRLFYGALGNRHLLSIIPWNPLRFLYETVKRTYRVQKKGIEGNYAGDTSAGWCPSHKLRRGGHGRAA